MEQSNLEQISAEQLLRHLRNRTLSVKRILGLLTVKQYWGIGSTLAVAIGGLFGLGAKLSTDQFVPCYEVKGYPVGTWLVSATDESPKHARTSAILTMTSSTKGFSLSDEPSGRTDIVMSPEKLVPGQSAAFTAKDPEGPYEAIFRGTVSQTGCSIEGEFTDNAGSILKNGEDRVNHRGPQQLFWYGAKDYWVKAPRK